MHASIRGTLRALAGHVRDAIPEGRPLADDVWRKRHRGVLVVLWLHAAAIAVFALLRGFAVGHSLLEAAVVAVTALLAGTGRGPRKLRSALACLGLVTSSALLVHISGGYIELHFHFFVMVALMALYQDWATFLLAVGYVVLHHGLVGVLEPHSVYNHPAAWAHPWLWAGIHGAFIMMMSAVVLFTWRLNEAAHARTQLILDSTAEGILGVDLEGRAIFVNVAATRMLGWGVEELMGRPIGPRVSGRFPAGTPGSGEDSFRTKDGRAFPVEYVSSEIREHGTVVGTVVAFKDISERKRAEEKLQEAEAHFRQAQKMDAIGQLAGGIAHDFNNLLTVIIGRGQILRDRLKGEANQRAIGLITSTAQRAATLTQRLLAFSRKQVLQPRVLDLGVVVSGMASMLQRVIGEHIDLVTLGDRALDRVSADPSQIEQVILNLVVNSRDAMPHGGTVTIETRNVEGPEPGVTLVVKDTGCGMDGETRSRMFEPFFTTKGPGHGTGLGLATVYGIVKQHEGTIAVDSAPGAGTTIRITLSRVAAADEVLEDLRVRPRTRPSGYETILLVDDDEGVRQLARDILRMHRYRVVEAASPLHAIALAEAHAGVIDLLVTDVVMPGMSGRELAARLARLRPGMRILYTSGYPGQTIASHGVLDGHAALLRKPFAVETLTGAVRDTLDRSSAREGVLEPVG